MSEAQAQARALYAQDPSIDSEALAAACNRTRRWATGELKKLKGEHLTKNVEQAFKPLLTVVPTTEPEPIESVSESLTEAPEPIAEPTAAEQPEGARLVAWLAFALGLAASVAANVTSAGNGVGPRLAAAFAPVAVLLAVEVLVRTRWQKHVWLKYAGLGVVAAVAAVVSYGHQRSLLLGYGESTLNATILPLAVDGLLTISATALIAMKGEK